MKKNLIWLFLLLCAIPGISCDKDDETHVLKLVWEENFDQTNGFDTKSWSKIPRGTSDWNNYMSDFDSLYQVSDGNLILRGINNYTLPNDTAPYLTGGLYTKDKVTFTYGKVEIEKHNQHLFLLGNMNLFVIYHHRLYTFGHFVKIGFPHDDKWEKRYSNYVVGQHKGFTHNNSYKSHCLKVVIIISLQNYIIYINKRSK